MILKQFVYKDYPREVPLGIIRPKYYKKTDKRIPIKYQNDFYDFDNKGILVDCNTLKPVLKNPKEAGTRRMLKVSGQSVHNISGNSNIDIANYITIKKHLKEFFEANTDPLEVNQKITTPVTIEFIFITTPDDVLVPNYINDLDNYKQFYEKVYLDTIQEYRYENIDKHKRAKLVKNPKGFIPNDNMNYVKRLEYEVIIAKERKLIINIKQHKPYEFKNTLGN